MNRLCLFVCLYFLLFPQLIQAQDAFMYRLALSDKGNPPYSIDRPEEFLSAKAIERRTRQGFLIDETDLPISADYFVALTDLGAEIRAHSKWVNTITILLPSDVSIENIAQLPFIQGYQLVWKGALDAATHPMNSPAKPVSAQNSPMETDNSDYYGDAQSYINQVNGVLLHDAGFRGRGITIAIMDGGFAGVDTLYWFNKDRILGIRNFSHEYVEDFRGSQDHGTRVLSCLLPDVPYDYVGTAPEADYYLFKTEVNADEYPVEEDYWVRALEYADSLGVDIVSTSLGYTAFTDTSMNHTHSELDGFTVPMSRAASMAARKGMLLCNSAGNSGSKEWRKLNIPSDASDILTVGSVAADNSVSSFTSHGYTADGRIKPDVAARGSSVTIIGNLGKATSNGTSLSCPIVAGMTACLWQALPHLTSLEVMELVRKSGSRSTAPDSLTGYGIPDFYKAYQAGRATTSMPPVEEDLISYHSQEKTLSFPSDAVGNAFLTVCSLMGNVVLRLPLQETRVSVESLPPGLYIARLQWKDHQSLKKFIR